MDVSHNALLLLVCMVSHSDHIQYCCGKTYPESPVLELGQKFTATCVLSEDGIETGATADDIFWEFKNMRVPKERYTRINDTAVSMTVNVTRELENPLKCNIEIRSPSHTRIVRNVHGLFFTVGYPPEKPGNLSCIVLQSGKDLSNVMTCSWNPGERDPILDTNYTLFVENLENEKKYRAAARRDGGSVEFVTMPVFLDLNISVEAENPLGKVRSDALVLDPGYIVRTDPPKNLEVVSEEGFPTSLLLRWVHPIEDVYFKLKYNIRYCPAGAHLWSQVPPSDTADYIKSFRLQFLEPNTNYVVQVQCMQIDGRGYWSKWSQNVTACTPESVPSSPPDLWRVITSSEDSHERRVRLIWKDPVHSNGRILGYNLTIQTHNRSERVQLSSSSAPEYVLEKVKNAVRLELRAYNSVGSSPPTSLSVPRANQEPSPVKTVQWQPQNEGLWVGWECAPPSPTEFVLEWVSVSEGTIDWKRLPGSSNYTVLTGALQPFERYHISVTPVSQGKPRRPVSTAAYLRQGRPSEGPSVKLTHREKTEVQLEWDEPRVVALNGFITNYTLFCTGDVEKSIVLPPSELSYRLTGLSSSTKYVVRVMVSTVAGSTNGSDFTFTTLKYASGEIEVIVVIVCLSFLFLTVLTVLIGINKKEMIKKHIWPQVPDPSNSTIANWSPDFPSRPETPKEGSLTDVSVVEVDVFEKKSLGEEDKTSLPLKKDKYLSEEHSSGIGGSSCMSSPRQSVSDSDEGDSGQTTASAVQYSSVVASGYKGQTPGQPAPPVFARSESTQPLLGSEEHQDEPCHAQRYTRNPYFKRPRAADEGGTPPPNLRQIDIPEHGSGSLGFCSVEEGSQQTTPTAEAGHAEGPTSSAPSYMAQQNGYRPQ